MLVSLLIFSLRFAGCKERFFIYAVTIRYKDFVFDHESYSRKILVQFVQLFREVYLLFLLQIQKEIDLALLPCVKQGFFEEKY